MSGFGQKFTELEQRLAEQDRRAEERHHEIMKQLAVARRTDKELSKMIADNRKAVANTAKMVSELAVGVSEVADRVNGRINHGEQ